MSTPLRRRDFWEIAKAGFSSAPDHPTVDDVRQWATLQNKVEILQALEPSTEGRDQARSEIMTWPDQIDASSEEAPAKKRIEQLETAIEKGFGTLEKGRNALIIVARVIEAANRSGLSLPVPNIPRRLARETNPFTKDGTVKAIRTMRSLQQLCQAWISSIELRDASADASEERKISTGLPEVPTGLILLSAILEGDLLHRNSVEALGLLLNQQECPLRWWGKTSSPDCKVPEGKSCRPFIDLRLRSGTTEDAELRRWFPDPQTACLIARAYLNPLRSVEPDDTGTTVLRVLWIEIKKAIADYGKGTGIFLRSLNSVLTTVRLALLADNYSPLVVAYCERRLVSHSIRRSVLPRLMGNRLSGEQIEPAYPLGHTTPQRLALTRADEASISSWYGMLLHALRGKKKYDIERHLKRLSTGFLIAQSSVRSFVDFPAFLIRNCSAAGNMLAPSTIRNYASLVARYLGGCMQGDDPSSIPYSQLVALYHEAVDLADQGNTPTLRKRLGQALAEFHHYLVRNYLIQGIDPGTVFGIGRNLVSVDANLLTPDEYFDVRAKVVQLVRERNMRKEIGDIALVLLSLGFWLGLRRTEARGLRTIDVCELGIPMLVVRPWEGRRLKTKSCSRVLPLNLLPEQELFKLIEWTEKRRRDNDRGIQGELSECQYLFGVPKLAQDVVTTDIFDLVQQSMRMVTGDSTLRYHHLRHSAASWSFLRLCLSDFVKAPSPFPMLPRTNALLSDSSHFRETMYDALPTAANKHRKPKSRELYAVDGPIRQHAFAVARLLGHASPGTTLEHYIHFLDLVVPMYRRTRQFFPLEPEQVTHASGYMDNNDDPHDIEDLPALVWRQLPPSQEKEQPKPSTNTSGIQPKNGAGHWVGTIWSMLFQADTEQLSATELSVEYNLEASVVDVLLKRARELKGKRLHSMTPWTPDLRSPKQQRELNCPDKPGSEQDRRIIDSLESYFFQAMANRARAKQVLEYFVANQNGFGPVGPLYFEDPNYPDIAMDYLNFLKDMRVRRLYVEKRSTNEIAKPSEMRFVSYTPGIRQCWEKAIPSKSRDDIVYTKGDPTFSPQGIGILAHFGVAPTELMEGSLGFRFFMLMAWIAWPWLETSGVTQKRPRKVTSKPATLEA